MMTQCLPKDTRRLRRRKKNKLKDVFKKQYDDKGKEIHTSSSIYDEEVRAYNRTDPRQEDFMREEYQFEFYVDNYSDDKIKEIISIFRNDFKPPKNLWIENMNIQSTADANYFNDVFADDDNYNDSDENSPNINDANTHSEEIDDIGYNITDNTKSKQKPAKAKPKEDLKTKDAKKTDSKQKPEPKQKQERDKDEQKYSDRIKPSEEINNEVEKPSEETKTIEDAKSAEDKSLDPPESLVEKEPSKQSSKHKKKQNQSEQPAKVDLKITKAKDGLNIEISDGSMTDIGAPTKIKNPDQSKKNKSAKNSNKITGVYDYEDLNKTRKIHSNLLKDYDGGDQDSKENEGKENISGNNISIGKLTKECEDEINEKLQLIQEEKAKLELEQLNRKKKNSKSKNRANTGQKSTREGYIQNKKKRPHSHKKRGSATMMQELKKKMGFINSQTSRGRTGGDKFLNYSLDEINQKLQSNIQNMCNEEQKGMKKRLNKSFENVFSA